ncbi:MAG: ABC transporter ATP-binding protein/permease [Lachnospiraceae bacterium]|nr:ABC transporter ATP-binding protein/permease [Lachnospiraceae bacterium]
MSQKRSKRSDTFRMLMNYLKPHMPFVCLSVLMAACTVALTLYLPVIFGYGVDCITGPGAVDLDGLKGYLMKGAIALVATAFTQWLLNLCNNRITFHVTRDIRNDAMEQLEKLPLKYIDSHAYGDIVSRIIADVDQLADGLLMGFTQLFTGVITILGTLVFMFTINGWIALLVVALTPVSLLVARFIATRTYSMFQLQSSTRGEETALVQEMIEGQKVIQLMNYQDESQDAFKEVNERLRDCSLKAVFYSSITNPATRFVNNLVYAAVALTGALTILGGGLTVGELVIFLSYANQYTKPFNEISGVITELQNALACAGRIFEILEEEPQTPDPADAKPLDHAEGSIDIEGVWFSYTPEQKLIEDFSLKVKPGQRVAIVGPTGCGKTTLINLLMRFYDPQKGTIAVDGTNTLEMTRKDLRSAYGMVLQETWLKSGTILENIKMGKPDATMEEVLEAAKAVHSYEFIRRMPEGFDTVIGEDGGGLSQGQKQLLCITRVMIALPPMLILDEATSSIDTRTELQIQNAFAKLMEGRTSFIVAHRLSTIQNADIILVMKDGHIVEQGTHEELLKQGAFYAKLYNSQFA